MGARPPLPVVRRPLAEGCRELVGRARTECLGQPVGELRLEAADGDEALLRRVDGVERVPPPSTAPSAVSPARSGAASATAASDSATSVVPPRPVRSRSASSARAANAARSPPAMSARG